MYPEISFPTAWVSDWDWDCRMYLQHGSGARACSDIVSTLIQLLPALVLFSTLRVAILGLIGLIILHAVLSWVPNHSPIAGVVARLAEPLLAPLRRVLPNLGGLDFSPLVALVILQVLLIVLGNLQAGSLF